jgi:hypothetical protein
VTDRYCVFGLLLESDFTCPELLPAGKPAAADLRLHYSDVPDALERPVERGSYWETAPGQFLMKIEGVGKFLVRDGNEIRVQPAPGASEEGIRLHALSACLSILLLQRRLLVLHCSGVDTPHGAVLFAGRSGAGKSTMVSAFLDRGSKILADDMLALNFDAAGRVMALPGFPQVKLWADSARALGRSTQGLQRVSPDEDKFIAPEVERFSAAPAALHAIYDLRLGNVSQPSLTPLDGTRRFNTLLDNTWHKATLSGLGIREWHFATAARIASLTYMARLVRTSDPLDIQQSADLIEQDLLAVHAAMDGPASHLQ